MKFASRAIFSTLAGSALVFVSAVGASASTDQDNLRAQLTQDGVPQAQVSTLEAKMKAGETLDVFKAGAKPVSITKSEENGAKTVDARYSDGSYSISSVEIPVSKTAGSASPLSVDSCISGTAGDWTTATNCMAKWTVPAANVEHRVNARWIPGVQGAGQIDSVYGAAGGGVAYVAGSANVSIAIKTGNPAISSMTASFQTAGVAVDRTFQLFVSKNGMETQPAT